MHTKLFRIGSAVILTFIVVIVWAFFQIRSDYYAKVSISLAARFAEDLTAALDGYYDKHQRFPLKLSDVSQPSGDPGYIPKVTFDPNSGVLTVAIVSIEGNYGTISYSPNRIGESRLQWQCRNGTVAIEFLPPQCSTTR